MSMRNLSPNERFEWVVPTDGFGGCLCARDLRRYGIKEPEPEEP